MRFSAVLPLRRQRFRGCSLTTKARRTIEPGLVVGPVSGGGFCHGRRRTLKKNGRSRPSFERSQARELPLQERHLFKCAAYALLTPLPPSQHPRLTYRDTADTSDPRQLRVLGIFQVCGRASHLGSDISQGS